MQAPGVQTALSGGPPIRSAPTLFTLSNRVALVTGGHRSIGLEIALALAEAGAIVYCLDLPAEPDSEWRTIQRYVAELPADQDKKGRLEYISADVTDQKTMWSVAEKLTEKEGRIDICFANAGIYAVDDCLEYPAEDFRKMFDVNTLGAMVTAQAAAKQMVRLGTPGSIIMTGSISASITNPTLRSMAYNASKAAVLQMTRSMACELAAKHIRVNSISPGYINTEMTRVSFLSKPGLGERLSAQNPMGRFGRPDELRGVALFLASDASTFCTGSDIIIDGGQCAW
ncbi:sorbose reductase sou1 [Roridomyces roridus]|uniref:Sorbose reductase sou1 n=1 Tax=Roridomyces roridus TaxID=1738132 RepID=A0AAD7CLT8_9AGAR|nr:sorbose reductase sou1 [Roridomyces roridus]